MAARTIFLHNNANFSKKTALDFFFFSSKEAYLIVKQ